jgi:hypothetical protein
MDDRKHDNASGNEPRRYPPSEPEIIPPDRAGPGRESSFVWMSVDERSGAYRVHVARPNWLTIVLVLALVGLVAATILIVLLGAVLVFVPIIAFLAIALIVSLAARHYWSRLQVWWKRR